MTNVTASQAVAAARRMIGQPYWFAASGQRPTEQFLQSLINGQFSAQWTPARIAKARSEIGRFDHCFDCSGLMRFITNRQRNIEALNSNANRMRQISNPQPIATLPEAPGVCVFMNGHVGIYAGRGRVIEAWGWRQVCDNALSFQRWTHWGRLPWISCEEPEPPAVSASPAPAVGDLIILNGPVFRDSFGNGQGRTFANHRGRITIVADTRRAAPFHVDHIGWTRRGDLRKAQVSG